MALTMIQPGTEKPPPARGGKSDGDGKPPRQRRTGRGRPGDGKGRTDSKGRAAGKKPTHGKPRPHKPRPPKPRKPLVPITKKMKAGAEPMRTFGDLKQFFDIDQDDKQAEGDSKQDESQ